MVLEGDERTRLLLTEQLAILGFEPIGVASGLSGLSQIIQEGSRRPSAGLLLGLQVPALDGMAILQELQVRRLNIPIIMMSGADDIGFLREAVTAGARDYLVTPIDKELFKRKCLRTFLGQSPFA
jgi:FixJ family two-component response regulator